VQDGAVRAAFCARPGVVAGQVVVDRDAAADVAVAADRGAGDRLLRLDAGGEGGEDEGGTADLLDPGDVDLGLAEGLRARDACEQKALVEARGAELLRARDAADPDREGGADRAEGLRRRAAWNDLGKAGAEDQRAERLGAREADRGDAVDRLRCDGAEAPRARDTTDRE